MEQTLVRESLCEKTFCAVTHQEGEVHKYLAFPMRCKSWDCPKCRKIKTSEYRKRMKSLGELPSLYFYTFTYDSKLDLAEAWATYNVAWNRLRTAAAKRYGRFNYVRVLEAQPHRGYPHVHVIADKWFEPTWLGPECVSAGFGYQLDSQKIDSLEALDYISKYLSKEWTNETSVMLRKENRCRIISFSRGLLSPVLRKGSWEILARSTDLGCCMDHILTSYTWVQDAKPSVVYERDEGDWYEVHVVFERICPPGAFSLMDRIGDNDHWFV